MTKFSYDLGILLTKLDFLNPLSQNGSREHAKCAKQCQSEFSLKSKAFFFYLKGLSRIFGYLGFVWEFIREWKTNGMYLSKWNEWKIKEWK